MMTAGFFGGLALMFVGIAILVLITSIIRLLGPILIVVGIYYLYKTLKARGAQPQAPQEEAQEEAEPEVFKDAAEILAEKYENADPSKYSYENQYKKQ